MHFDFSLSCIGGRNGNPLQCSCLENPRDGGAWWAAVSGVAQSRTRLKRLSSSSSASEMAFSDCCWPVGSQLILEFYFFNFMNSHVFLGFPGSSQLVKNRPAMQEIPVRFLGGLERSPGKGVGYPPQYLWAFLMAQMVKNLPATQELWV